MHRCHAGRIVVSTHTISLQEQLISKDLPLLNAVIPREFSSVLVKGRGNYLSKRRLELAVNRSASLISSDRDYEDLESIRKWSKETHEGSLSSLPFKPSLSIWDEVASDSGNCMGRKCKNHASCFYYTARRRVFNSQILVVNHAIFFSDLALRAQGGSNAIRSNRLPQTTSVCRLVTHRSTTRCANCSTRELKKVSWQHWVSSS